MFRFKLLICFLIWIWFSDKVYIFGGRHSENRLNDLHCLDIVSMTWTSLLLPSDSPPVGRSWQSLTPIYTGKLYSW